MDDGSGTNGILREAGGTLRLVAQARAAVTSLVGRGRSPDGSVRVRVGGDGLIETVRLRPEAMHLDSVALARQVYAAVRSAQESLARQAGEVRASVLGGRGLGGHGPDSPGLNGRGRDSPVATGQGAARDAAGSGTAVPDVGGPDVGSSGVRGLGVGSLRVGSPGVRSPGVGGPAGLADPARLADRLDEVQAHLTRRMEEFGRSLDELRRRLEG